ncbi:hypothetical protein ACGFXC_12305 [Streptomyces sp. NPDC048507]|uniref:hypothetical protein n=1 Tax=Streptomyces sp. NPDC048507 TaxID=3365560 RepID=UPI003710814D
MSQNFQPPAPSSYTEVPAPAPAPSGNLGLGVLAAVVAAVVAAGVYGGIIGGTKHEIGYAAIGVGALVGFAAGKIGGRNPALSAVAALLSLAAIFAGQLFGIVLIAADELQVGAFDILGEGFSPIMEVWKADADLLTYVFLGIGGYASFQISRKVAN